jgi:glucose-1-phosphate thymidylyltransferase
MKIIIPMAGIGKRMRPHTLTIPKPLIHIAGKPMVQRLTEAITSVAGQELEEIAFIIGDFGKKVEDDLLEIAAKLGAKGKIYYQQEPLGTAHAIYCAEPSLDGRIVVAFADTLFHNGFKLDENCDGVIGVSKVDDPHSFGVVKTDKNKHIMGFIEKPQSFVSGLAIIGIYYFKDGAQLRQELKYLLDNHILKNGEYQLTDALENMLKKGVCFTAEEVDEWLDCGNKDATIFANQRFLEFSGKEQLIHSSAKILNSFITKPCFIGENVSVINSVIGPHVSIGENSCIEHSLIRNSIIQANSLIKDMNLENSMIGNNVECQGRSDEVNLGDYTTFGLKPI